MIAVSSTPSLAEHADADGFHREGFRPELAQLLDALVGDHHADQEGQHAHDHQGADPDLVHLADHGAGAKAARLQAGLEEDHQDLAEEGAQIDELVVDFDDVAADFLEPMREPVDMALRGRAAHVLLHHLEQVGMGLVGGLDLGVRAVAGKLQDLEGAGRIEALHGAGVDQGG